MKLKSIWSEYFEFKRPLFLIYIENFESYKRKFYRIKYFFRCRMNKDLMEKQELKNLGLQNIPEKKT